MYHSSAPDDRHRSTPPVGLRRKRYRQPAVIATMALAATALAALPASASITGNGVRAGSNITVLHNIDLIAVAGYGQGGGLVTIEVLRNGVTIGSASGPAQIIEGASGLEVNHGVEGDPAPGDCFDGHTPDVRPGDVIQVTDSGGTDEVTVDDISFTGDPVLDGQDVLVHGVARRFNGTPIPPAQLNGAEFRAGSPLRAGADEIQVTGGPGGAFTMRYEFPFDFARNRDNLSPAEIQDLLLGDGHAIGIVGVSEGMLVEGLEDTPGPAAGCEVAPLSQYAVTNLSPATINARNQSGRLTVAGMSTDATNVRVELRDASGNTAEKNTTPSPDTGAQTWRVSFTAAELAGLDGRIRVSGFYTVDGTEITGLTRTMVKDTVRPNRPVPSLDSGVYRGTQRISLAAGPGERIRYTLGNGKQPRPTRTSGNVFRGGQIAVTSTQVLKAIAIDGAGNVSPVARHRYAIRNVPSRPRIRRAAAGAPGGASTAVARWAAPARNNGARISGYKVVALKLRPNGSVESRRASRMLASGARSMQMRLRPGRYTFRVRAFNAIGRSPLSARSNPVRSR